MCIIILRSWRRRKKFEKHFTHWNVSIIDIVIFNKLFFLFNEIYTHGTSNNKSNEKFSMTGSPYHSHNNNKSVLRIKRMERKGWKWKHKTMEQIYRKNSSSVSVGCFSVHEMEKWSEAEEKLFIYPNNVVWWYKNYIDFLFRSLDKVFFDILICMQVMLARK